MKAKSILTVILTVIFFLTFAGCSKVNSMNKQLDELEKIIVKYEPQFSSLKYESKEYSDMIVKYNEEIFAWAEIFEQDRYKRDANDKILYDSANKPIINAEFDKDVEKRFYALNNRMTNMVLATIPKKEKPEPVANENEVPVTGQ